MLLSVNVSTDNVSFTLNINQPHFIRHTSWLFTLTSAYGSCWVDISVTSSRIHVKYSSLSGRESGLMSGRFSIDILVSSLISALISGLLRSHEVSWGQWDMSAEVRRTLSCHSLKDYPPQPALILWHPLSQRIATVTNVHATWAGLYGNLVFDYPASHLTPIISYNPEWWQADYDGGNMQPVVMGAFYPEMYGCVGVWGRVWVCRESVGV